MPLEGPTRIVRELTSHGYNAEREAVTLLAGADRPGAVLERVIETVPDDALVVTTEHVRTAMGTVEAGNEAAVRAANVTETQSQRNSEPPVESSSESAGNAGIETTSGTETTPAPSPDEDPSVSTGDRTPVPTQGGGEDRPETRGARKPIDPSKQAVAIANDMTGESTGTGEYKDFVAVFRDRLERLGSKLKGRVNHRPATSIQSMPGGGEVGMVGLVNDVRSTASGHWLIELEDATGTFPWLVMKDREYADLVDELLCDEVLAMEGTLADDSGIAFVDSMYFPDVPRTHEPSTADRHVQAALISDVHVGSQEFMADAWNAFTDWLHTEAAQHVEYLLIAGDMVEGVGVYPNQDEELDVVDIYDQYEVFNEYLKQVPGDLEIVMIPGNHDAVRLAEPQPGFDERLRGIMDAHDPRIVSNPSTVTLEGVSVLLYHGVSLDEVIAELPAEKASYDEPHRAMYQLLKKRHVAPQFGGHTRLAPEERDYLIIDEGPDIFHTGHVHKLGFGKYHNVLAINSGCWQAQTDFQKSVNIDPDAGYAPIVDLDTLDVTVQKFS